MAEMRARKASAAKNLTNILKLEPSIVIKAIVIEMRYFTRSAFPRSFARKKNFGLM